MAIAGLKGSPVGFIASQFNNLFSDNDLVQNMHDMFGDESATAMAYGLPTYLGISLTPQGAAPLSNPAHDIMSLMEPVMYDRVRALVEGAGTAWQSYMVTGEHPAESPDVRRLIAETVAPRTIMRLAQQFMADDAIASSRTGYPLKKDPTFAERVAYVAGISTADMQKRNAIADILYKDKARRSTLTAGYGEALKDAIEAQDLVALVEADKAGNKRRPGYGISD